MNSFKQYCAMLKDWFNDLQKEHKIVVCAVGVVVTMMILTGLFR